MTDHHINNDDKNGNNGPLDSAKNTGLSASKVIALAILLPVLLMAAIAADYFTTVRLVKVSDTTALDARGGKIIIQYSKPTQYIGYYSSNKQLQLKSKLSRDGLTETHTILKPTRYNHGYQLVHRPHDGDYTLFGLFLPPEHLKLTTGKEKISIKGMIPAEHTRPGPETLNNQLVLKFNGDVIGKYKKDINISVAEMDYVKLTPEVKGYYRWINKSTLSFNFTESKPGFDETYHFDVFPDKFVNQEYQTWVGKKTEIQLTTSINEVYIDDFSLTNEVNWQDNLRIEFSGNMVSALEVLKKKSPGMVPVTITPKAGGTWVWSNARTLEFHPDDSTGWPVRKTVTVSILPQINTDPDRKWRYGAQAKEFTFHVKPREQSIRSYNLHGTSVKLDEDMVIDFSRPMVERYELRNKIPNSHLANNIPFIFTPHVDGHFYWVKSNRLKFHPANLWSELTEYTVTLNPNYNPDKRYEWTGTEEFSFKTVENIVYPAFHMVTEIPPSPAQFFNNLGGYSNSKDIRPEERLWILFDKDIGQYIKSATDMAKAVRIEPPVKGKYTWLSNSLLEFVPDNNWHEETNFSVHLTRQLLHHPQQHFAKNQDVFKFSTAKNLVYLSQIRPGKAMQGQSIAQQPNQPLVLNFSKNMIPLPKIGKTYWSAELDAKYLPVAITPKQDFSFKWKNKRELTITPAGYWKPETSYKISFNHKLLPQKNASFAYANFFNLETAKNYLSISKFTPQGRVERRAIVDVEFDRDIRPAESKIGSQDKIGLFSIQPPLAGNWIWLADNKIQFKPTDALQTSTRYKVMFDPNKVSDKQFSWHLAPPENKKRYEKVAYQFYTPALHVQKTNARFDFDKKNLLKQRFYLDIELSAAVKPAELRKHFSIWYKKQKDGEEIKIPLIYKLQVDGSAASGAIRKFSVVSDWIDRPASDRRIYYTITKGIMPVTGNLALDSSYVNDFLQEKPKNISAQNIRWEWEDGVYKGIFSISAPVEPSVLAKFLTISRNDKPIKYQLSVNSTPSRGQYSYEIAAKFHPGQRYDFTLAEGMLAADGAFTAEPVTLLYSTPNLPSKIKFALKGNILSRKDLNKVPVLTTNLPRDRLYISIDQIYANNVNQFINHDLENADISQIAKRVHAEYHSIEEITGGAAYNEEVVSNIDMSKLFKKNQYGLYRISIGDSNWTRNDQRWFLSTDIGLVSRRFNNHVLIWANSLHSQEALAGVEVLVYDRWNQVIARGNTNYQGFVDLTYPEDGSPTHVVAQKDSDFSFIDLARNLDKLTGYDTEGISSKTSTIRSFIYSDRGVYRPGEVVHLVAVTRGKEGVLPDNYPVKFRLNNPTGKEIIAERFKLDKHGIYVYDFHVPAEAKTGKWKSSMLWDNKLTGNYTFQVEEFIPNKIDVKLKLLKPRIYAGDTLKIKVAGKNLFGPPASGLKVSGGVKLLPSYFKPKGFSRFRFGHDDNRFQRINFDFAESRLDEKGNITFEYKVPKNIDSPIGVTASYSATVIDDGGRGVSSYGKTDILLFSQYVGIRRLSERVINLNTPIGFEVVNVDVDGNQIPRNQQQLKVRVYRNKSVTHYRKNERGYYRYVSEKERILVDELDDPRDEYGKFKYQPRYAGEHILEVQDNVGKQVSRYRFYVTGEQRTLATQAADKVQLKVLTKHPQVDGSITLEIQAPFAGKVLLTGEREKVLFTRVLTVDRNKKLVTIPVTKEYLPNFYISAVALQPVQVSDRQDPIYATGLTNVEVKDPAHTPQIKLLMPHQASPNGELAINVNIGDMNHSEMFFTVAAVDEGILNLTKFKTPRMDGFFNQKRKLEVQHLSMYPLVMPYEPDYKYDIDPSGGAPSRSLIKKKRVNPESQQRVKSVALWSGLQKLDEQGNATIKFKLPDFNGRLRVMVVAYGNQRFVSKQQQVVIRDKLVMKPTLPRFLSTGDHFSIPMKLFNSTGLAGNVKVNLQVSDQIKLQGPSSKTVYLSRNGEAELNFAANVENERGVAEVDLAVEGLGEVTRKTIKIPVRTPGTLITLGGNGDIDEATPRSIKMPDGFIDGTQEYAMKITSDRLTKFQGGLSYLLGYPYGCLEQTTSKVFPLLYYSDLASSSGDHFSAKKTPRYYVREGIKKIQRMQLEDGRFAYWEGTNTFNSWAFMYASNFLVEAHKAGYKVDETVWNNMLYQLRDMTSKRMETSRLYDRSYGISDLIYGLYVLAIADQNVASKLNYIYDNYLDDLRLTEKARLAAAFAASGDSKTAKIILQQVTDLGEYDNPYRDTGGNFASSTRDLAIVLDAIESVDDQSAQIPIIIDKLTSKMRYGRWGSTQENAFAFLAIGRALTSSKAMNVTARVVLGDGSVVPYKKGLLLRTPELLKGEVRVEVSGKGQVAYHWEAVGIDKNPKSLQQDKGIQIRRRYLDKNGKPVDLNNLHQGQLVVVELRMESLAGTLDNMVITDLLPMGLEIENARLSTSASLPWIKQKIRPDYVDIRDDRINIFLTVKPQEYRYYYTTRAVTVGRFAVPPTRIEAMYDPDIFSEANRGKMRIRAKK